MNPRTNHPDPSIEERSDAKLGVLLSLLLMLAYFGFIGLGAFAPVVLAWPLVSGGTVTVAFAYGLFVIGLGVALTSLFVWLTNRRGD